MNRGEFRELSDDPRPATWLPGPALTDALLTTADIERATGIAIQPGMVINYEYREQRFRVRVLDGDDGLVLANWTDVPR